MADNIPDDELRALYDEINMAEALNEQELEPQMREALERYTGRHVPDIAVDWSIVLNEIYPIIQFYLPSTFFRNPRAYFKPRQKTFIAKRRNVNSQQMEDVELDSEKSARTQEAILNYELGEIHYKQEVRKVLLDALLFKHGVLWHGYKGKFGMTAEQSLFIQKENVFVRRLNPLNFLKSPATHINMLDEARWIGRSFDVPLVDVLEDDDLKIIEKDKLTGQLGFGGLIGTKDVKEAIFAMRAGGQDKISPAGRLKPLLDRASKDFKNSPFARFIRLYEIFLLPSKKEARDGSKGRLLLLTKEQFKPLRQGSWPYKKAEGLPAKILMFNEVPEQQFGMADIETYSIIADHKNLVINQQIRNAEQTNKVWIAIAGEGANEEDVEKMMNGSNTFIRFEGDSIRDKMQVVSAAGAASPELYQVDGRIQANLDDKSGVSDLKRGSPPKSGEESAASVRARMQGSSARPAMRQDTMSDFLLDSMLFLNDLIKEFFPIKKAVRIIGSTDVEWSDNFTQEEIQADVDVSIDPISMLPENPEREIREIGEIMQLMFVALQDPAIRQKIAQEGKTFNLSPLIDTLLHRLRIRNPEIFRNFKPEETQGFAPVAELRAAQANIVATTQGQQPPSPPAEGQSHRARLEVYVFYKQMLEALGEKNDLLELIIQAQAELLQAEQDKEAEPGKPVPKPSQNFRGNGRLEPTLVNQT